MAPPRSTHRDSRPSLLQRSEQHSDAAKEEHPVPALLGGDMAGALRGMEVARGGGGMTCIVGIAEAGKVWIGGDSAGGDSRYGPVLRSDRKVFRNGAFIFRSE